MAVSVVAPPARARAALIGAVKLAAAVLLSWAALRKIDFPHAFEMAGGLSFAAGAGALALLLGQALLSAWRWSLIGRRGTVPLPFAASFRLFMVSLFYNQVLPSTVPGDAARVWGAGRFGGL